MNQFIYKFLVQNNLIKTVLLLYLNNMNHSNMVL